MAYEAGPLSGHPIEDAATLARIAGEYRDSALLLLKSCGGKPSAPCRLLAIHSVELYLSALLLHHGVTGADIRRLHHDLSQRLDRARAFGLRLRQRTEMHIRAMSDGREYLLVRYGSSAERLHGNRMVATLEQLGSQVCKVLDGPVTETPPPP